ncbi:Inositol-tetrakisphosphate 1-kinase [Apophysomyces ossiformis]|uniref:Inositol-tetrakisphosphate 1-kinase n=1 Tax=Apophysomyces ossiformis TaxID=679940 RepID=A0A8H7BW24_9FUNG|nr:Inositol-tetrakisphosphate 1-kinase [Apophysomyces ossiformis]
MNSERTRTIGLVFSEKKIKGSGFVGLEEYARQQHLRLTFLDLTRSLEDQGPIDVIVHKITDVFGKMQQGDENAREQYMRFVNFCATHPDILVLDDWVNIEKVIDRNRLQHELEACAKRMQGLFSLPKSVILGTALDLTASTDIRFPAICKPLSACSSVEAHQMAIIPSRQALSSLREYEQKGSVMLQEFIQHDGVVVKVYVADGQIYVSTRPSFQNIDESASIVRFNSQVLPKAFGIEAVLSADLEPFLLTSAFEKIQEQKAGSLDMSRLQRIADCLRDQLGLTFFGFDVLLESKTNEYYVVDVNYFPGFSKVPEFHRIFLSIVLERLES